LRIQLFKIYKEFLFDIIEELKICKYAYDKLKKVGVFNDDDDKIYDFDYLIKYYYDKMNDKCYSGIMRKCNELLNNPECFKYRYEVIDNHKICPKLKKSENNENIKSLILLISSYIRSIEVEIRRYTDEEFCNRCEIIYIPDLEYQEFKKVQPHICEKAKTTIFKRINRDLCNRFLYTDSKKYVECFGIGIENVYPDYPDDEDDLY